MLSTKTIRHRLTKMQAIKYPLTWVQHRGLNPSDVFIASYPRAGSTWLRFMLFEILTGQSADFESVDKTIAGVRNHANAPVLLGENGRFLQTHEPYRYEYNKAIYLVRDVRDVVILSRRLSIIGLLLLGYIYYRLSGGGAALASIGLVAFIGVSQVLPALIGGIFWRGATRVGRGRGPTGRRGARLGREDGDPVGAGVRAVRRFLA